MTKNSHRLVKAEVSDIKVGFRAVRSEKLDLCVCVGESTTKINNQQIQHKHTLQKYADDTNKLQFHAYRRWSGFSLFPAVSQSQNLHVGLQSSFACTKTSSILMNHILWLSFCAIRFFAKANNSNITLQE